MHQKTKSQGKAGKKIVNYNKLKKNTMSLLRTQLISKGFFLALELSKFF